MDNPGKLIKTKQLVQMKTGISSQITRIEGNQPFLSRATSIGFTGGAQVEMLQNHRHMPLIVYIRDTQVAIDRKEAEKIHVEES